VFPYVNGLKMATKSNVETRSHNTEHQHNLLAVKVSISVQVTGKVTQEQATKVQRWSRIIAVLFL